MKLGHLNNHMVARFWERHANEFALFGSRNDFYSRLIAISKGEWSSIHKRQDRQTIVIVVQLN